MGCADPPSNQGPRINEKRSGWAGVVTGLPGISCSWQHGRSSMPELAAASRTDRLHLRLSPSRADLRRQQAACQATSIVLHPLPRQLASTPFVVTMV